MMTSLKEGERPQGVRVTITNKDRDLCSKARETYSKLKVERSNSENHLVGLIQKVFLRRIEGAEDDDIIKKFLVVYHTLPDKRRDEPSAITSCIARLIYCLRLTIIKKFAEVRGEGGRRREAAGVTAEERETDGAREDRELEILTERYAMTATVRNTPFSMLYTLKALLHTLTPGMAEPNIQMLECGRLLLMKKGKVVTFGMVKEACEEQFMFLEDTSNTWLGVEDIHGLTLEDTPESLKEGMVYDIPGCTTPGYSFADQYNKVHGEQLRGMRRKLLLRIRSEEDIAPFLGECDKIMDSIFICLHHDAGGAAQRYDVGHDADHQHERQPSEHQADV
jgi:hypothetical protein